MKTIKFDRGFTLVELLVVMAVIGILMAIIFPIFSRVKENSRKAGCLNNLKAISAGLILYADGNFDGFPTDTVGVATPSMMSLNRIYPDYVSNRLFFDCPSDPICTNSITITEGSPFTLTQCSYGYDRHHHHVPSEISVAIVSDRPPANPVVNTETNTPNHSDKGQNVVYIDGHAEFVGTPTAGWMFQGGARDHIYLNADLTGTSGNGGTDSVILHDG